MGSDIIPSKPLRVGVNGCGRIGRTMLRMLTDQPAQGPLQLIVANDVMSIDQLVYLLNYDSIHGVLSEPFDYDQKTSTLSRKGWRFKYIQHQEPPDWSSYSIDILVELSAAYRHRLALDQHLTSGAPRILLGQPLLLPDSSIDPVQWGEGIYGVFPGEFIGKVPASHRHQALDLVQEAKIFPAFSCTSQALTTLLEPLLVKTTGEANLEPLAFESIMVTELHGYTTSQQLLDAPHRDWRRGRAAASSIIPTMTQGIFSLEQFFPQLENKVSGYSARVPINNVAAVDVNCVLRDEVSLADILYRLEQASQGFLKNRLAIDRAPLVSVDYIGRSESAILAEDLCHQIGRQVRLFAWYDNEIGYSARLIESLLHCAVERH